MRDVSSLVAELREVIVEWNSDDRKEMAFAADTPYTYQASVSGSGRF
jgi:hypothetical protein